MVKAQFVQRDAAEERTKLCIFFSLEFFGAFQDYHFTQRRSASDVTLPRPVTLQ